MTVARSPLTEAEKRQIVALHDQGFSATQIGTRVTIPRSKEAILSTLTRAGREPRMGKYTVELRFPKDQLDATAAAITSGELTIPGAARKLGISRHAAARWMARRGRQ
jgi:hypothetical protein